MKTCTRCGEVKAEEEFHKNRGYRRSMCKTCSTADLRARRQANPQKFNQIARKSKLKRKFGITQEDYDRLLALQGGKCAICGRPGQSNGARINFDVDHDHETGQVRGLLCSACNRAIGLLQDDPRLAYRAAEYLSGERQWSKE